MIERDRAKAKVRREDKAGAVATVTAPKNPKGGGNAGVAGSKPGSTRDLAKAMGKNDTHVSRLAKIDENLRRCRLEQGLHHHCQEKIERRQRATNNPDGRQN